jgi:acyl-CoA synthetase (AMP-forming)/AMP-acid ligase II
MSQLDLATLHEAISAAVPDRECLVWRDRRWTWREVTGRTRRLARVLHEHFRTALSLRLPNGKADYAAARDIVRRF